MPAPASDSSHGGALVLSSSEAQEVIYPIRHEVKAPIARLSISWARGNSFRVSIFRQKCGDNSTVSDVSEVGGQALEVKIRNGDGEVSPAEFRRIAYGSVSPFALLQSRKNMVLGLSKMSMGLSQFNPDGWEYVAEYSKDVSSILGNPKSLPSSAIEDPLEVFEEYDSVLSTTQPTVYKKIVDFQTGLDNLQVVEDNSIYWDVISSALAVGWQEIVVKLLRLHGSYQLDQLNNREVRQELMLLINCKKIPYMMRELFDV